MSTTFYAVSKRLVEEWNVKNHGKPMFCPYSDFYECTDSKESFARMGGYGKVWFVNPLRSDNLRRYSDHTMADYQAAGLVVGTLTM